MATGSRYASGIFCFLLTANPAEIDRLGDQVIELDSVLEGVFQNPLALEVLDNLLECRDREDPTSFVSRLRQDQRATSRSFPYGTISFWPGLAQ